MAGHTGLVLAARRRVLLTQLPAERVDLRGKRLLIFIVAYNAESTLEKVLTRIPKSLSSDQVEVLICIRARPLPDARHLLKETICSSSALRAQILDRVA